MKDYKQRVKKIAGFEGFTTDWDRTIGDDLTYREILEDDEACYCVGYIDAIKDAAEWLMTNRNELSSVDSAGFAKIFKEALLKNIVQ